MPFLRTIFAFFFLSPVLVVAEDVKEFVVMVYNIENVFDADGIALYDDYNPAANRNPQPYTPAKVLTKIKNLTKNIALYGVDDGPEIILFQEFEQDRSPGAVSFDYSAFLSTYADTTVDAMLTTQFNSTIADLPAEAFALKYMQDAGLGPYYVAVADPTPDGDGEKAHNNVVFTRFPILDTYTVPTQNARPIQVVTVDVDGHPFTLINNHWKSGASSYRTERNRIVNAIDTRIALDAILQLDPYADVIVAGDLNTYYNAKEYFPGQGWHREDYAIDTLGSQGDELAIRSLEGPDLYNLWFELPEEARGSEFYRGAWGTLMQILVTRGLYDQHGIQYIDGSFDRHLVPGVTVTGKWDIPADWYFYGNTGGGYSDHLPVIAKFKVAGSGEPGDYIELDAPSTTALGPDRIPVVDFSTVSTERYPKAESLRLLSDDELPKRYGELFEVFLPITEDRPLTVKLGERELQVYTYDSATREVLKKKKDAETIAFIGQLGEYGGKPQFVIHDASWVK